LQSADSLLYRTDLFKVDPKYEENERKYAEIKAEILGDDDSDEESGSDVESDDEEEGKCLWLIFSMIGHSTYTRLFSAAPEKEGIQDMTETDLINMRRTIYLTIMNSLNFEEAVHKLLNVQIPPGNEVSRPLEPLESWP
jgi:pre-mRNA-splicing factor CWC22